MILNAEVDILRNERDAALARVVEAIKYRDEEFERRDALAIENTTLRARAKELEAEKAAAIDELAKLREKLPKTADGVTITPYMDLWVPHIEGYELEQYVGSTIMPALNIAGHWIELRNCYSTRKAAIAARKERDAAVARVKELEAEAEQNSEEVETIVENIVRVVDQWVVEPHTGIEELRALIAAAIAA